VLGRGSISKCSAAERGPWQALHMEKPTARAEFMLGVTQQGQGTDTGDQGDPVITSEKTKTGQRTLSPRCTVITLPKRSSCDPAQLNSLLGRK